MKVILYMATTVNGLIAKKNDETPWSEEEYKSYFDFVKKRRNIVVGRRTYEIMKTTHLTEKFRNVVIVVLSHSIHAKMDNAIFVSSAREAIKTLKKMGFKEIVLAGGGRINGSFLDDGLIDEIYLDVEPMVFGDGIELFSKAGKNLKLRLLGARKLSRDTIQLHYKVIK